MIATNGDTHLGGDDIDNLLIAIALDDIKGDQGVDLRTQPEAIQAIRKAVIEAKIALSAEAVPPFSTSSCPTAQRYQREIDARAIRSSSSSRSSIAPPLPASKR